MAWPFKKKQEEPVNQSAYFRSETPLVSYWSFFDDQTIAEQAAERLRVGALSADVQPLADEEGKWLMLAYMALPESEDVVDENSEVVKAVVRALGGEYDGWEAGPLPDQETVEKIQNWLAAGVGAA